MSGNVETERKKIYNTDNKKCQKAAVTPVHSHTVFQSVLYLAGSRQSLILLFLLADKKYTNWSCPNVNDFM